MIKPDFNNFIISENNKKAFEACCDFVRDNQKGNILSLYGPWACGKTHLISAIKSSLEEQYPDKKINNLQYFKVSELLTAQYLELYYDTFSNSDLLIIDDLHLVKCKGFFQEIFAEIANNVLKNGGKVVVAFECPIINLKVFFDNIRFASLNQIVEIKYPDINLMREFIKINQKEYNIKLSKNEEDKIIRSRWLGVLRWFSDISWERTKQELIAHLDKYLKKDSNYSDE